MLLHDTSNLKHQTLAYFDEFSDWSRRSKRQNRNVNGQITVALRDPIGELEGQISLQVHGGMPQKVIYNDLNLERNPQVKLLGMNEAELNKLLKIAPEGFIKSKAK